MTLRIGHWALVAATLAAGGLIAPIPRSPVSVGIHSSQPAAQVAHIQVPVLSSAFYTGSLGIADGEIVVGDLTSRTVCQIAIVNPISWRVSSNRETSCTNPALDAQSIMPVESVAPKSTIGLVRIATTTRVAGAVHLGPVVMRYENDSASLPEWTYGGGYLWLYDTALSTGVASIRRSPEVLRIDESTGQVSATVTVPSLPLVELAADADGLWMARSEDTSWSGSKPPALLYFVGTRSRYPKVVVKNGDYVTWLAAAGHQRVGEPRRYEQLWHRGYRFLQRAHRQASRCHRRVEDDYADRDRTRTIRRTAGPCRHQPQPVLHHDGIQRVQAFESHQGADL